MRTSVGRLRRSLTIGICVWMSCGLLDLFVTQVAGEGSLRLFLAARAVVALIAAFVIVRLRREPEPSVRLLWFFDVAAFGAAALCVSLLSLAYRGLESSCATGIVAILVARGATTLALFAAHVSRPLEPVSSLAAAPVPAALERLVERCMARDPAQRYASTRALLDALHAVAGELSPPAAPAASGAALASL